MSRSAWKPLFVHPQYVEGLESNEIKRQNRSRPFTKKIIGQTIHIYNGTRWYTVTVSDERLGQSIGQFAPTRHQPIYKKKTKLKIKK
jgi:ribosomal protein S19